MFGWLPSSFKGGTGEKGSVKERKAVPREVVKVVVVHSHTGGKKMWEFPGEELAGVRVRQACIVTPKVCSFSLSQASSCAHKKTNRDFTLASLVEAIPMSSSAQIQQGLSHKEPM